MSIYQLGNTCPTTCNLLFILNICFSKDCNKTNNCVNVHSTQSEAVANALCRLQQRLCTWWFVMVVCTECILHLSGWELIIRFIAGFMFNSIFFHFHRRRKSVLNIVLQHHIILLHRSYPISSTPCWPVNLSFQVYTILFGKLPLNLSDCVVLIISTHSVKIYPQFAPHQPSFSPNQIKLMFSGYLFTW